MCLTTFSKVSFQVLLKGICSNKILLNNSNMINNFLDLFSKKMYNAKIHDSVKKKKIEISQIQNKFLKD